MQTTVSNKLYSIITVNYATDIFKLSHTTPISKELAVFFQLFDAVGLGHQVGKTLAVATLRFSLLLILVLHTGIKAITRIYFQGVFTKCRN